MRNANRFVAAFLVLGLALLPVAGALVHLGASLTKIERMHGRAGAASARTEMIGSYVEEPGGLGGLRVRPRVVARSTP